MNTTTRFFVHALLMVSSLLMSGWVRAETDKFMAEGVVRKIDPDNRKITLKHGEIKNLQMPGMTMVFRLQETVNLDKLQAGDKVLFHVEKIDGAFVITDLQGSP